MIHRSSSNALPDLDGREFRIIRADPSSQTDPDTRFFYHQRAEVVWGEYSGGEIATGRLVGRAQAGRIMDLRYCHLDTAGTLCTGVCLTEVVGEPGLPLRLLERWRWTGGREGRGQSVLEEILPPVTETGHSLSSAEQKADQT